jgi:hypothetical protein
MAPCSPVVPGSGAKSSFEECTPATSATPAIPGMANPHLAHGVHKLLEGWLLRLVEGHTSLSDQCEPEVGLLSGLSIGKVQDLCLLCMLPSTQPPPAARAAELVPVPHAPSSRRHQLLQLLCKVGVDRGRAERAYCDAVPLLRSRWWGKRLDGPEYVLVQNLQVAL